jgi:excisionase family DNA binding protein
MSAETPPLISREEAARLLGTSERHLRRLIQQGHLPLEQDARGTRGLRLETVDELAAKRRGAITQLEAAERLGCDRRTVRRMLDDGRLQAVPTPGGRAQVALASVEARRADMMGQPAIMGHEADTMGHRGAGADMMGHAVSQPVPSDAELVPLLNAPRPSMSAAARETPHGTPRRIPKRRLVQASAAAALALLGLLAATLGPGLLATPRATAHRDTPRTHAIHRSARIPTTPKPAERKPSTTKPATVVSRGGAGARSRGGLAEMVSHPVRTQLRHDETPPPTATPEVATPSRPSTSRTRTSVSRPAARTTPTQSSVCSDVYGPEGLC